MLFSERIKSLMASVYFALFLFLASFIGVFFVFTTTNPAELGATGMLVAFGVFYTCFLAFFLLLFYITQSLFVRQQIKGNNESNLQNRRLSIGRFYGIAATLAFAPVIFMALRSIGQLDIMSTVLVIFFELVAIFYILKR